MNNCSIFLNENDLKTRWIEVSINIKSAKNRNPTIPYHYLSMHSVIYLICSKLFYINNGGNQWWEEDNDEWNLDIVGSNLKTVPLGILTRLIIHTYSCSSRSTGCAPLTTIIYFWIDYRETPQDVSHPQRKWQNVEKQINKPQSSWPDVYIECVSA